MIKITDDGTLCTSNGDKIPHSKLAGRDAIYRHHIVWAMHNDYMPARIGRVDGDNTNADISNLYDMSLGVPIVSAAAVVGCGLWKLFQRLGDLTPVEMEAIARPPTQVARDEAIGFFRAHGEFVPIGDAVVDKQTGAIRLRHILVKRLVEEGVLCYEDGCYKLTSPAT